MATYAEMVNLLNKEPRPRRCMFIAGDQSVLAEDLIARAEAVINPDPAHRVSLSLDTDSQKEMWAEANSTSGAKVRRLVIARHAERLTPTGYAKLHEWVLSREIPDNFLILSSDASDWPGKRQKDSRNRWMTVYDHNDVRARMKASGRLVNTTLPRDPERAKANAVAAITIWGNISHNTAEYAYTRTGGSLVAVRDVMWKARYFDGEVTPRVVDALAERSTIAAYSEALIACDRARAASAAVSVVTSHEIRKTVRRLEDDVLILGALNRALRSEESVRKVADKAGINVTRALSLAPHAAKYDSGSVGRRLQLISASSGREGALEQLAMLW